MNHRSGTDDSAQFTKQSVEATELGRFVLMVNGTHPIWRTSGLVQRLQNAVILMMRELEDTHGFFCCTLRLLVVTAQLPSEVARWQRQLGIPEGVSCDDVAAKTITWGTGDPKSTHSVVVLDEYVAVDLIAGNGAQQREARACLAHELAHVYDDLRYRAAFGPEPPPLLGPGTWGVIRKALAHGAWGEYFAELITCSIGGSVPAEEAEHFAASILEDAVGRVAEETAAYFSHGDPMRLWLVAVERLSAVYNQMGRCLAILDSTSAAGNEELEHFLARIGEIVPSWEEVVRRLSANLRVLLALDAWSLDAFDALGDTIDLGFLALGLDPYRE